MDVADIYMEVHQARRKIEVSAGMLMRAAARGEPYRDAKFVERLENDVWNVDKDRDEIGPKVSKFVAGVETHCLPVVAHRYSKI
jgi:hypothetical protein